MPYIMFYTFLLLYIYIYICIFLEINYLLTYMLTFLSVKTNFRLYESYKYFCLKAKKCDYPPNNTTRRPPKFKQM